MTYDALNSFVAGVSAKLASILLYRADSIGSGNSTLRQ